MAKRTDEGKTELTGALPEKILERAKPTAAQPAPPLESMSDTADELKGVGSTDPGAPADAATDPGITAPALARVPERVVPAQTQLRPHRAQRSVEVSRGEPEAAQNVAARAKRLQLAIAGLGGAVVGLFFLVAVLRAGDPPAPPPRKEPTRSPASSAATPKPTAPKPAEAPERPPPAPTVTAPATPSAAATPALGTVRIVCEPEVDVLLDGQSQGTTPVAITRPPGSYTVVLENTAKKFRTTTTVRVEGGKDDIVYLQFAPGWVDPQGPEGTRFLVDGKPVTSRPVQVWSGMHKVDAVFSGGQKQTQQVEVQANLTSTVDFNLNLNE